MRKAGQTDAGETREEVLARIGEQGWCGLTDMWALFPGIARKTPFTWDFRSKRGEMGLPLPPADLIISGTTRAWRIETLLAWTPPHERHRTKAQRLAMGDMAVLNTVTLSGRLLDPGELAEELTKMAGEAERWNDGELVLRVLC